jgi:hypothetical protein
VRSGYRVCVRGRHCDRGGVRLRVREVGDPCIVGRKSGVATRRARPRDPRAPCASYMRSAGQSAADASSGSPWIVRLRIGGEGHTTPGGDSGPRRCNRRSVHRSRRFHPGSPELPAGPTEAAHHSPCTHRLARCIGRADCVGFFDFWHGQNGVAPNAIELHPVLGFSGTCRRSGGVHPPPPPRPPGDGGRCAASYPDECIPPPPPDLGTCPTPTRTTSTATATASAARAEGG